MQVERIMEENYGADYRGRPRKPMRIVEPFTPIPRRASAYPENIVKIRPKYVSIGNGGSDNTGMASQSELVVWQHDSAHYQAESSLSTLSLMHSEAFIPIDERDTVPAAIEQEEPDICELTTVPPVLARLLQVLEGYKAQQLANVADIDTVQSDAIVLSQTSMYLNESSVEGRSVQPSSIYKSELWQEQFPLRAHPLERIRGWLLRPGHLELLLWLLGTLLLMCMTGVIVCIAMLSL